MSTRTAQGHLVSIATRLAHHARTRDWRRLYAYVRSEQFRESFAALDADRRLKAVAALAHAHARCEPRRVKDTAQTVPGDLRRKWGVGTRVQWKDNDELIAKLRRLAPRFSSDLDLARALGINEGAAKLGRYRYARAPVQHGHIAQECLGRSPVRGNSQGTH